MKFSLTDGTEVALIGDPHLGRKFETGVPLHRRGERERRQLENFKAQLAQEAGMVVVVGDLFDHPHVGFKVVLDAYQAIVAAANDDREIFVMAGNHDLPRNLEAVGAFEMLEALLAEVPDVQVVRVPRVYEGVALFPWQWNRAALEQVDDVSAPAQLAIGHWDLQSFGGDDSHMAPTVALKAKFGDDLAIYSGHYHLPGEYQVDGHTVICTGSMEPYSHAEDPTGDLYVTLTLAEIEARDDLHDKVVRVLLAEGEELPVDVDCLALTAKRAAKEAAGEVSLGDFDWSTILAEKLAPLTPEVRDFIEVRLGEPVE